MRELSRTKRILLFTLASVLLIVSGILFLIGGSVINKVPKDQPAAVQSFGAVSEIAQTSFAEAPALEPVPAQPADPQQNNPEPQEAGASNETDNSPAQKENKGGVRAFISNMVRRN